MEYQRIAIPLAAALLAGGLPATGRAQPAPTPRYAVEPSAGMELPTAGMAGEQDALTVSTNPAGLHFLSGWHVALAVDTAEPDEDEATGPGPGLGLFAAGVLGGGALPRLAWGFGLEFLRPPRAVITPDPGTPTRFTWAHALPLGRSAAVGVAWHHFFDGTGGVTRGLDTFDAGLSIRLGAHLAAGFAVRDLTEPQAGGATLQRRYELELALRPTGDDRLELGMGGRAGEDRADLASAEDLDGWLRGSLRVLRGIYVRGQYESRSLLQVDTGPSGADFSARREHRLTAGLELSFGGLGAATYASTAIDGDGDSRFAGGTVVVRASQRGAPSLLPRPRRIERIELRGDLGERELTRLISQLRQLERDDELAAILLQVDSMGAGWAATSEVRRALAGLRARGVRVYVYMVAGTTRQYYLASVADKIYVDPAGGLRLSGMVATSLYFKGLFDKLGVVAQFEKIEEYKSAPEAYTRTGPTEPAFTMRNELYDSMYEQVVQEIAAGRHIDASRVRTLIDSGPYTSGELAKIPDLVDRVVTPDELAEQLVRELGAAYPVASAPVERDQRWGYPAIAVIYIDGDIVDGKSSVLPLVGTRLVGGDTIAAAIAAARGSSQVDAIVLRINSPGGSALASEVIAREVFKTRGVKPIICSLGDVAASGGYFAAAGCDTILADPMTITGSIGIFTGKFDLSGLLGRVGVSWTMYKRGALADMDSFLKSYSQDEQRLMKRKLHYYYGRFIRAVAEGRALSTTKVDAVGRGRVWTGSQARPIRLIDRFGGIGDAIEVAKREAGMDEDDEARLLLLPTENPGLFERLLGRLVSARAAREASAERGLIEALLPGGADRALLQAIPGSLWAAPGTPQARLPFGIDWSD
jgi:protease-4